MSSSPVATVSETKKERAPRLTAKFGKFLDFGFYFVNHYNQLVASSDDGRTPLDTDALYLALQLFAPVPDQQALVQGFFDQTKDLKKQLRDVIKQHAKTNKPPVQRKPRVKKASVPPSDAPSDAPPDAPLDKPKAKRGRKPAVKPADNPDIVAEIVALAQNSDPTPTPTTKSKAPKKSKLQVSEPEPETISEPISETISEPESKPKSKPKAETKPKSESESEPKPKPEPKSKPETKSKSEPKPKSKPETKSKSKPEPLPNSNDPNPDDEPLPVQIIHIHGQKYLIDDDSRVKSGSTE